MKTATKTFVGWADGDYTNEDIIWDTSDPDISIREVSVRAYSKKIIPTPPARRVRVTVTVEDVK